MRLTGEVTPFREAILRVAVLDADDEPHFVDAVVDTGFTEYLTLSQEVVTRLRLPLGGTMRVALADGTTSSVRVYSATALLDREQVFISVMALDGGPLLGMSLMHGCLLTMQVVDGGRVSIATLD
jgi:clan AA aspartic protease